jgi:hypothetical protein
MQPKFGKILSEDYRDNEHSLASSRLLVAVLQIFTLGERRVVLDRHKDAIDPPCRTGKATSKSGSFSIVRSVHIASLVVGTASSQMVREL